MMRLRQQLLLLCCLLFVSHAAWADGVSHLAFHETFNQNNGTGGRDDAFTGNVAQSKPVFDAEGWAGNKDSKISGGKECIKFGTADVNGICTTPEIVLVGTAKTATLTFSAAGWGSGDNTLAITANEGVGLSGDTQVTLTNGQWKDFTVTVTLTTAKSLQLTFTGRRGFLDDVKVTETVTAINAPTLPDEFQFWPKTTESKVTTHVTLVPSDSTTVYYTTDGSEPSASNGVKATLTTNVSITGTTTVKARAYYETVASDVVSRTYTFGSITANSIFEFKQLDDDTEARLFLSADAEARVLHAHDGKLLFLRDKTGALCLDFGTTATFNPTPKHNQHVAGWIVGRKATDKGLTKLVATANTNTNYLALAAPVMEADTEPTLVEPYDGENFDFSDNTGDWVTFSEGYVSTDLEVENVFGTENVADKLEYYQLADVSAIVVSSKGGKATVAPVAYNDITPVVYVLNEDKNYGGPATDIPHATIRLKRTLSKDYWNTLVVPFEYSSFSGEIRTYSEYLGDNTMHFSKTEQIEAGLPYLVKPSEDIVNPVFSDIKLSAMSASSVNKGGDYEFVGTYSPVELSTDKSMLFLTRQGQLAYPSEGQNRLKGTRAYFYIPDGSNAPSVVIDGVQTDISSIDGGLWTTEQSEVYNLNGQRVSQPSKGIYIINGKKVIIR